MSRPVTDDLCQKSRDLFIILEKGNTAAPNVRALKLT